jgi:hypothetical protein
VATTTSATIMATASAVVVVETGAYGRLPMTRAQPARYADNQPFTQPRAAAREGSTGSIAAAAKASPSRGATAGAARAFANTE